jgi:hypothetical protein
MLGAKLLRKQTCHSDRIATHFLIFSIVPTVKGSEAADEQQMVCLATFGTCVGKANSCEASLRPV